MKRQLRQARFWSIAIFLGVGMLWLLRHPIEYLLAAVPRPVCYFHQTSGYLCPACGNTRAVLLLLNGHPLRSAGYNPMILTLFLMLLGLYGELVLFAVGKPHHLLPRRLSFWMTLLALVLSYDILRNFFPAITLCSIGLE